MKEKCPNCGQFKFEKSWGRVGCGWFLLLGVPIIGMMIPGMSDFYGGNSSFSDISDLVVISMGIGIIILVFSIFFPSKTISYKCSNCDFEQIYNK